MTAANIQNQNVKSVSNTQDVSVDQEIKNALLGMKKDGVHNEAVLDCLNAINFSVPTLEQHLTTWLWLPETEDFEYGTEEDKAYSINLGAVEEELVMKGLIYND